MDVGGEPSQSGGLNQVRDPPVVVNDGGGPKQDIHARAVGGPNA